VLKASVDAADTVLWEVSTISAISQKALRYMADKTFVY